MRLQGFTLCRCFFVGGGEWLGERRGELVNGRFIRWKCLEWFALARARFFVTLENDKPISYARSHYCL
jgi:hypothetical protein